MNIICPQVLRLLSYKLSHCNALLDSKVPLTERDHGYGGLIGKVGKNKVSQLFLFNLFVLFILCSTVLIALLYDIPVT